MKIVVKYEYHKWEWTELYGLKDLLMLIRHLMSDARTVVGACIIIGEHVATLL